MITEDYVSFETAKLLKEKGFDCLCEKLYSNGSLVTTLGCAANWNNGEILTNVGYANECSAPTIQMAMKWLREVHKIQCDIGYDDLDWFWNILNVSESVPVEERPMMIKNGSAGFKSYEEAAEAAIMYCLKNLI